MSRMYVVTAWELFLDKLEARQRFLKDQLVDSFTSDDNLRSQQLKLSCAHWQAFENDAGLLASQLSLNDWNANLLSGERTDDTQHPAKQLSLRTSLEMLRNILQQHCVTLPRSSNSVVLAEGSPKSDDCIAMANALLTKLKYLEDEHYDQYLVGRGAAIPPQELIANQHVAPSRTAAQFSENLSRSLRTDPGLFRKPVTDILRKHAGSCSYNILLARLDQVMKDQLTDEDRLPVSFRPSLFRWHLSVVFLRQILIQEGVITWDAAQDVWHLVDADALCI
jgi:hypothetical protein